MRVAEPINAITEALVKHHLEIYIDLVFFDYLPRDEEVRLAPL
jgi:hypothetical protein